MSTALLYLLGIKSVSKLVSERGELVYRIGKKYNLEEIVSITRVAFGNLSQTYKTSDLTQKRILHCSIFTSNLTWGYLGISNRACSPMYQYIRDVSKGIVSPGDPTGIRTRIAGMRIQRPEPLDDRANYPIDDTITSIY